MPRSFALGGRFEAFIEEQVRSGRYNNASEVVRDGLRLLEDTVQLKEARLAELCSKVEEARRDPVLTAAEDVFARLEAKYRSMSERGPE